MKQISIPDDLYKAIEKKLDEYGFKTVDEYVVFVLKEVVSGEEEESENVFSEEEEEIIKKRLRDLGYLD